MPEIAGNLGFCRADYIAHARRLILDFGREITAHVRVFIALQDRLRALPP